MSLHLRLLKFIIFIYCIPIWNSFRRPARRNPLEDQAVDISGYPDGLYMLKIEGDYVTNWMKLIKQ